MRRLIISTSRSANYYKYHSPNCDHSSPIVLLKFATIWYVNTCFPEFEMQRIKYTSDIQKVPGWRYQLLFLYKNIVEIWDFWNYTRNNVRYVNHPSKNLSSLNKLCFQPTIPLKLASASVILPKAWPSSSANIWHPSWPNYPSKTSTLRWMCINSAGHI